jgi:hypothetical protein
LKKLIEQWICDECGDNVKIDDSFPGEVVASEYKYLINIGKYNVHTEEYIDDGALCITCRIRLLKNYLQMLVINEDDIKPYCKYVGPDGVYLENGQVYKVCKSDIRDWLGRVPLVVNDGETVVYVSFAEIEFVDSKELNKGESL